MPARFGFSCLLPTPFSPLPRRCHKPLPDPIAVYIALENHLRSLDAFKTPEDFLNGLGPLSSGYGSMAGFLRISASQSFQVAEVPTVLVPVISQALENQRVPFSMIEHRAPAETRLWVNFESFGFICGAA